MKFDHVTDTVGGFHTVDHYFNDHPDLGYDLHHMPGHSLDAVHMDIYNELSHGVGDLHHDGHLDYLNDHGVDGHLGFADLGHVDGLADIGHFDLAGGFEALDFGDGGE